MCKSMQHLKLYSLHIIQFTQKNENPKLIQGTLPYTNMLGKTLCTFTYIMQCTIKFIIYIIIYNSPFHTKNTIYAVQYGKQLLTWLRRLCIFRCNSATLVFSAPGWNLNGCLETRTLARQAATTELLVAGLAQWVRFVWNRWQEKSPQCAWPITYEKR